MIRSVALGGLLLAALSVPAVAQKDEKADKAPEGWQVVKPKRGGGITVFLPKGEVKTEELKELDGESHRASTGGFTIGVQRDMRNRKTAADVQKALTETFKVLVERAEGKILSEKKVSLKGYPGVEYKVKRKDDTTYTSRIFYVGGYLVGLHYTGDDEKKMKTFFDSLKLPKK